MAGFDASGSTSGPDVIASYEWDWSYDGVFEPSGDTGVTQAHVSSHYGEYTVAVRVTDADGSSDIAMLLVVLLRPMVDVTPPVAPRVSGFAVDTGLAPDGVTSDNTPTLSGTAEALSTITVFMDEAPAGTTVVDENGNWAFTVSTLADGMYAFTATATDAAGNTSDKSAALTLVIDTTAPAAPVIVAIADDAGTSGDGITNDPELIFTGTAEANSIGSVSPGRRQHWHHDRRCFR